MMEYIDEYHYVKTAIDIRYSFAIEFFRRNMRKRSRQYVDSTDNNIGSKLENQLTEQAVTATNVQYLTTVGYNAREMTAQNSTPSIVNIPSM
jgi:hypothetical protein